MSDTQHSDGGPAWPSFECIQVFNDTLGKYADSWQPVGGMSLRDYYVGQAIAGLCSGCVGYLRFKGDDEFNAYAHGPCNSVIVDRAFVLAGKAVARSAMLAQREGTVDRG